MIFYFIIFQKAWPGDTFKNKEWVDKVTADLSATTAQTN